MIDSLGGHNEPLIVISDPDSDRYANPRLIPWWDQQRLAAARVMVVGAGALGNEVLKNLALLGVGQILIIDFDDIETSNLGRSLLFRAADVGRKKADVAADVVRGLNPDVHVQSLHGDIVSGLGLGLFRRMDVVVGCVDNREARWAINRACWRLGVPWVDGGLNVLDGAVKVFVPPDGPCYECGMTESDRRIMTVRYSCTQPTRPLLEGRMPTVVTAAAITAGVQVQEVLKVLHGMPVTPGSVVHYDGVNCTTMVARLAPRSDCLAHVPYAPIVPLAGGTRRTTLGELVEEAQRHLGEGAYVSLDRSVLMRYVCSGCGDTEPVMRWFAGTIEQSTCVRCGEARYPEIGHIFRAGMRNLETRLVQLLIPPLHIIEAKNGTRRIYFELAGDAEAFARFARKGTTDGESGRAVATR